MIDDLQAKTLHLRERLVAHAERHIDGERDSVEMVALADELCSLANKLAAVIVAPPTPVADAALREANAIAVVIGQFQTRMFGVGEYHAKLMQHGRTLRQLLNAAGYRATGSVPTPEG